MLHFINHTNIINVNKLNNINKSSNPNTIAMYMRYMQHIVH